MVSTSWCCQVGNLYDSVPQYCGNGTNFGAIMGAWYGPVAYLWIIFGCIFAGAMHDYMSGMLSIRNGGAGLPELVGKYLGGTTKKVMLVFSVLL